MSREFYVPCTPYAYPQCGSSTGDVVSRDPSGMDCMPLRPGPFHYLISEQAKSLVALQELQNEVGALLEFRDLVIETFPNLRHKMAASATASVAASVISSTPNSSHNALPLSSPSSRRIAEWEPGKVRRRIASAPRESETPATSLPRSRSNSHSGGSKNSATVQDSGFSTETSSKDSASTAIPIIRPTSPTKPVLDEAEDELWNLLDVIHRKGIRLREEVESLQGRLENSPPDDLIAGDVLEAVKRVTSSSSSRPITSSDEATHDKINNNNSNSNNSNNENHNKQEAQVVERLTRENEQLIDKVAELEAEALSNRTRTQQLQSEVAELSAIKSGLEDRLRGLTGANDILTTAQKSPDLQKKSAINTTTITRTSKSTAHKNRFRTRTIEKNVLANGAIQPITTEEFDPDAAVQERRVRLGALDSILVSPTRVAHVPDVDRRKIAAILREHSPLELQRHLITSTVHNQCLQKRLDEVQKSTETLSERLDKAREENDDLRFQLDRQNIELEGTRALVRVLEKQQQHQRADCDSGDLESEVETREPCLEPGSSTESARDHHQTTGSTSSAVNNSNPAAAIISTVEAVKPSPRRRPPSRIPLPDSSTKPSSSTSALSSSAPTRASPLCNGKSDSRESLKTSLKSLTVKPPRDSSRDSYTSGGLGLNSTSKSSLTTKTRDSSRESLNKSLPKNLKESQSRESLSKSSLPRSNNSNRDSLNKSSLSRARDSLESVHNHLLNNSNSNSTAASNNSNSNSNNCQQSSSTTSSATSLRRPLAPARRSHSLARASIDTDTTGKALTDPPTSWCSSSSGFRYSDSSLCPDSLNPDDNDYSNTATSITGSTKIEFMIGSPTRRFKSNNVPWQNNNQHPHLNQHQQYFDSINSSTGTGGMAPESLMTDEFPPRSGEALAECDSLDDHPISSED
ncbi:bromodomain-containing protein DDB_G0270170 [Microplitis demolitor]|uniref:bromodomain-containing protein DDB_G0270170 n=1 Tax=Microplitis demolitor TaxID=69319 RepID=UPI0006D51D44|nr:bromodomain-containing protein DDB_G0270170 [Microplitis demolitor]